MDVDQTGRILRVDTEGEHETDLVGRALAEIIRPGTVLGVTGPLGAGKTRLARALAVALGVPEELVSSPTYVLMQEYPGKIPFWHLDAYRLRGPEQFEALGVSELWDEPVGLVYVEWAELVLDALPPQTWRLRIESTGPESRRWTFDFPVERGNDPASRLADLLRAPNTRASRA
ncbi:tRNA (adenosine(37)-N6)-threonylcarbamoyltransferase complex ATPase subunit type 1 TsaE [Isosphaeraceae bacterium EP7]